MRNRCLCRYAKLARTEEQKHAFTAHAGNPPQSYSDRDMKDLLATGMGEGRRAVGVEEQGQD